MDDIVQDIDMLLERPPLPRDVELIASRTLLVDAVSEIERLREVLAKIATLGANASDGSYLDECGILAASALMRPL